MGVVLANTELTKKDDVTVEPLLDLLLIWVLELVAGSTMELPGLVGVDIIRVLDVLELLTFKE